jgi:hypothetical protein
VLSARAGSSNIAQVARRGSTGEKKKEEASAGEKKVGEKVRREK